MSQLVHPYMIKKIINNSTMKYMVYREYDMFWRVEGIYVSKNKASEICQSLNNEQIAMMELLRAELRKEEEGNK